MSIFYGTSEDGSDAKEFEGFYVNPDNPNEWSNKPFTNEKKPIIIGCGNMIGNTMESILAEHNLTRDDVIIVDSIEHLKEEMIDSSLKKLEELSSLKQEPYVIKRLVSPFKELKPKCKHKFHQYTETRRKEGNIIISEWACECGKKL